MTDLRERVARAIWENRYPQPDWEAWEGFAENDGGNGRYVTILRLADAVIAVLAPELAVVEAAKVYRKIYIDLDREPMDYRGWDAADLVLETVAALELLVA